MHLRIILSQVIKFSHTPDFIEQTSMIFNYTLS